MAEEFEDDIVKPGEPKQLVVPGASQTTDDTVARYYPLANLAALAAYAQGDNYFYSLATNSEAKFYTAVHGEEALREWLATCVANRLTSTKTSKFVAVNRYKVMHVVQGTPIYASDMT